MKNEEGNKFDEGKPRIDFIPPIAIIRIAEVLSYGEKKYGAYNWCKGISYGRLYSAAQRHLNKMWSGEELDDESGLPHLAHAITNLVMLLVMPAEWDDRHIYPVAPEDQGDKVKNFHNDYCEDCAHYENNKTCLTCSYLKKNITTKVSDNGKDEVVKPGVIEPPIEKRCVSCSHFSQTKHTVDGNHFRTYDCHLEKQSCGPYLADYTGLDCDFFKSF